jgi:hypothetical protein
MKPTNRIHDKTDHDVIKAHPTTGGEDLYKWIKAAAEAFEAFDFEVCADYYRDLDWKWADNANGHIPTEEEIRHEVVKMMNTCIGGAIDNPDGKCSYMCSYGGLSVRAFKDPDPDENWIWIGFCPVETVY